MDDSGRLGLRQWANFDPSQLKDCLRDHPAVKLMDVAAERDAAFAERDTAIAEKKTANAERDAALLQRDVAYADRNSAWMERDTALATLGIVRSGKYNDHTAAKFMQMVNMAVSVPTGDRYIQAVPKATAHDLDSLLGYNKQPDRQVKAAGMKAQKSSSKKRKLLGSSSQDLKGSKLPSKKKRKPKNLEGTVIKVKKNEQEEGTILPFDPIVAPIPYCSCTGSSQQCYRWGKGGWQSACCTKSLSMYPLPMNPAKRSCRVPGRKMSGSAFKKLLERLTMNGVDITAPVDLKNHWAKHGTNRYVTIK